MFWNRKSKKQEGQEATDSAAEAAAEREETTAASGDVAAEDGAKDPAGTAEASAEAADDGAAEPAVDAGELTGAEKDGAAEGSAADEKAEEAGEADGSEDSDADDESDDEEDEAPVKADVFADEGEEAGVTGPDEDGITRVRTAGTFEFDGEEYPVVSNTWIIDADDEGVVVIDPGHDAEAILAAIGEREVYLVACTNAYSPHIESAIKVAEESEAPIALHPREMRAWRRHHGAEHRPEIEVEGQGALDIGKLHIDVLALPGTSPGTVGYYVSERGVVFGGDTLRKGEPGMVGNTYIDYTTQLASIGEALLSLPPDTRILPDRGPATTAAAEGKNFDSWV
ncbi:MULTISPECIES: MBL fold metallo-hydrolase [Nocardiopsis]|uniref:Zn-dependent hydrolase including glyoxylase n=1 Tax=Nocardiopsis dassonvillei (strain ATCC 23218 / DSM 43111 / CIP 107115 / JCM 7437 / KCTC 9190 / NBRC 14626 / NCTC 10488 / NRRL B-5397 / IMRU 509) TaxID=446468 RepID=D7B5Y8_NOCDD|nr:MULTISPECIES: MBL fold metallo-hydrolase [Nocardiopsis]ADH69231.1 Zn-dependent hydrolase including glyoxylase [Nocardiopsis dassonvillei subsp. dassonvillei DSM 43111]APC37260.1 Zn-dependent hydrolase [Nocardiopsis dassonvillei]NKY82364.1 MBL fold metallo-hydrolase [Nocardiopsis dassonvillei]VEI89740.1 hydroxyacylglutathione hydrolase [Nocardiopsis dassonvillei]